MTAIAASQTVCAGDAVSFTVTATGTGLTYQWRIGTVNLSNGGSISGATSATLVINPVNTLNAGNNYNVVVSGACAPTVTTTNISLLVNSLPVITIAPVSQTVCAGDAVSLPVVAAGTGLTYQWRKGTVNIVNGGNISGATTATLVINPVNVSDSGSNYNVVIFGVCSPSVVSANVSLGVDTSPIIILQPVNQMADLGGTISFSVIASGTGLSYQWRKGNTNLTNGGNIAGANSPVLTINPVGASDTTALYNVIVSGKCSPAVTSLNVTLWVCVCPITGLTDLDEGLNHAVIIYPNPFSATLSMIIKDASALNNCELSLYSLSGAQVFTAIVTKQPGTFDTTNLPAGTYVYRVTTNNKTIQSGKLIAQ